MEIKDLFTTYWSQVTLILLAVGYFIKSMLDKKSKKNEINHTLFQQNKLISVNNFFLNYAKVEMMWNQISIFEILSRKLEANEMDRIILPSLNELRRNLLELKIYFNSKDHLFFEQLSNGLFSINGKLLKLYFQNEINSIQRVNEFTIFKDEILNKNNLILNELCPRIRVIFDA